MFFLVLISHQPIFSPAIPAEPSDWPQATLLPQQTTVPSARKRLKAWHSRPPINLACLGEDNSPVINETGCFGLKNGVSDDVEWYPVLKTAPKRNKWPLDENWTLKKHGYQSERFMFSQHHARKVAKKKHPFLADKSKSVHWFYWVIMNRWWCLPLLRPHSGTDGLPISKSSLGHWTEAIQQGTCHHWRCSTTNLRLEGIKCINMIMSVFFHMYLYIKRRSKCVQLWERGCEIRMATVHQCGAHLGIGVATR